MSYFAQLRIVDENGNVIFVSKSGELKVEIEGLEGVLLELKKVNLHLSEVSGLELEDEDVGG